MKVCQEGDKECFKQELCSGKRCHRTCTPPRKRHSFRFKGPEPYFSDIQVQYVNCETNSATNSVGNGFVTIDLKDAYFYTEILPEHRMFLRFAFGGEAYQNRALPFSLALFPCMFTKCINAALAPLRLQGIHAFNYINDWLMLAQLEELAAQH